MKKAGWMKFPARLLFSRSRRDSIAVPINIKMLPIVNAHLE